MGALSADLRRAAAVIAHHGRGDVLGVAAVLGDAAENGRTDVLVVALLELWQRSCPEMFTPDALDAVAAAACEVARTVE